MPRVRSVIQILIAVALLTACAPAAPAPTAVPPTVTVAPTLTMTTAPTATLTPTLTPAPTDIPIPEGAVQAADGSALFVEDGKLFTINGGNKIEASLGNIVFSNAFDAGLIVKQLHENLYVEEQQELLDFLLPPETYKDGEYDYSILDTRHMIKNAFAIDIVGKPVEIVNIKTPDGYSAESAITMMMAVYGLNEPLPIMVGVHSNREDALFIDGLAEFNLYQSRSGKPNQVLAFNSKQELESALLNQRINFGVLLGMPNSNNDSIQTGYPHMLDTASSLDAEKYFLEEYGVIGYEIGNQVNFKFAGNPGGSVFIQPLQFYEDDIILKEKFLGYLPVQHQVRLFIPQ